LAILAFSAAVSAGLTTGLGEALTTGEVLTSGVGAEVVVPQALSSSIAVIIIPTLFFCIPFTVDSPGILISSNSSSLFHDTHSASGYSHKKRRSQPPFK
jgi:hypothetical protein